MIRYEAALWDASLWRDFVSTGLDCHVTQQLCTLHDWKQKLLGNWHHVQCVFNFLTFCLRFWFQTLSEEIGEKHASVRRKIRLAIPMLYCVRCTMYRQAVKLISGEFPVVCLSILWKLNLPSYFDLQHSWEGRGYCTKKDWDIFQTKTNNVKHLLWFPWYCNNMLQSEFSALTWVCPQTVPARLDQTRHFSKSTTAPVLCSWPAK